MSDIDIPMTPDVYAARLAVDRLRREVLARPDPAADPALLRQLLQAEQALQAAEQRRQQATDAETSGAVLDIRPAGMMMGAATTGLEARVQLRMAQVPTSIVHLLDAGRHPLVTCRVKAAGADKTRRVRVSAQVEGYSAATVATAELAPGKERAFDLLPTFFPERLGVLNELTRATLNLLVEDLDTGRVEIHTTAPIWLLARGTSVWRVRDPKTNGWQDMTRYLGAFVTPNAPEVMGLLREAAELHPERMLAGYQGDRAKVAPQVEAMFGALKARGVVYVNSVISFNPDMGAGGQRIRLPRESLACREANCIDGAGLFASLLEAASMRPALVLVPGHAFVAWDSWEDDKGQGENDWQFLETTMIGYATFAKACMFGERLAHEYRSAGKLEVRPVRELRTVEGITPME